MSFQHTLNNILPPTTDDAILDSLSMSEIMRFATVCHDARDKVQSYLTRHFKLSHVLQFWIPLALYAEFLLLMANTEMLISGSVALQFFARVLWNDCDLDLYIDVKYAQTVCQWLLTHNYLFIPSNHNPVPLPTLLNNIPPPHLPPHLRFEPANTLSYINRNHVLDFQHAISGKKIQIVTSNGSPLQTILKFHSTLVVNLIAHDRAYSIYPKTTLDQRIGLVQPFHPGPHFRTALEKYQRRGWSLVHRLHPSQAFGPQALFPFGHRFLGDSQTFSIPIDNPGPSILPPSNLQNNSWTVSYDSNMTPNINTILMRSASLRHSYIISPFHLERTVQCAFSHVQHEYPPPEWDEKFAEALGEFNIDV